MRKISIVLAVTHVFGCGVALEVGLDRLVLLVELGQIRDKVLDDVGVRKRVDARLLLLISGDTACPFMLVLANVAICTLFSTYTNTPAC